MRTVGTLLVLLFGLAAVSLAATPGGELALSYNWEHTNAPPSACGCFSLNGGNAAVAWNVSQRFALVGDIGAVQSNVSPPGHDLTITSYVFGPRFYYHRRSAEKRQLPIPFAQLLLGGAHASGALSGSSGGSANAFAFKVGGGVDLSLAPHLALRLGEADYFLTHFPNGINDRQNNFFLSGGVVFRFGER